MAGCFDGMMNAADKLHPTVKGYQVWADALKPIFSELARPSRERGPRSAAHRRSQRPALDH